MLIDLIFHYFAEFKKGDVALLAPVSHLGASGVDAIIRETQAMYELATGG
jgi:hypothetical protein